MYLNYLILFNFKSKKPDDVFLTLIFVDASCLTNGFLDKVIDWIPGMKGICLRDLPKGEEIFCTHFYLWPSCFFVN